MRPKTRCVEVDGMDAWMETPRNWGIVGVDGGAVVRRMTQLHAEASFKEVRFSSSKKSAEVSCVNKQ